MNKHINDVDEEALIAACKNGDRTAFGVLIKSYERLVYSTVKLKVGSDSDALDISQEVFIKIWRYIGRYRGESRFSSWVYKISVNAALDFLRRSQGAHLELIPTKIDDDGDETNVEIADENAISPEGYAEKREQIHAVREAIQLLTPEQREVLQLRDIEGLTYDKIAEMLGLEIGTVKSRINRARGNLREILISRGADKLI